MRLIFRLSEIISEFEGIIWNLRIDIHVCKLIFMNIKSRHCSLVGGAITRLSIFESELLL